jgi:hypothetical protein
MLDQGASLLSLHCRQRASNRSGIRPSDTGSTASLDALPQLLYFRLKKADLFRNPGIILLQLGCG